MCVKLNVQQHCRVSTLLGARGVAPGWRIFLPVKFASRTNSSVVHVCAKRFTPLHFTSQLLRQILRRRKEKAFSFHGVLAQFVHVAFERVVTLNLGPSIVLTLWTVKIARYNLKPRRHNAAEIWKRNIHWSFWICGKSGAEKKPHDHRFRKVLFTCLRFQERRWSKSVFLTDQTVGLTVKKDAFLYFSGTMWTWAKLLLFVCQTEDWLRTKQNQQ